MAATNNHLDYLWKSVIEDLFPDFLRFFYPKAEEIFNLKKFEFLDKELEKLYPDKEDGTRRRYADKLVKIQLKKGGEQWILIHIEVRGYDDKQFAERMFQYFYRILDRYSHPVTAIAIFTNNGKDTPDRYEVELLGTRLEYKFNTYRIIDQPEEALKAAAGNPFAQVILGAWTALMSGKMTDKELMTRHEWVFSALDKTLSSRKKMAVFAFLRYFVHFSDPKNYRIFETRLEKITGKTNVMGVREALLNQGKEIGIKKGKEIGIKEGKHLFVTNLLRATTFSVSTIASLSGVSEAFVRKVKKDLNKK
jgi:hypothetical protein